MRLESDEDIITVINNLRLPTHYDDRAIFKALINLQVIQELDSIYGEYFVLDMCKYKEIKENPDRLIKELL